MSGRRGALLDGEGGPQRRGGQSLLPPAEFTSYYGKPVINPPVWRAPDIPGYLFLGGLAGASSLLAAGAQVTGSTELARTTKVAAAGAISVGLLGLVHDLGRPSRFVNMLRVFKPTSPMSVGSWLLAGYAPAAVAAAGSALSGRFRPVGRLATAGAAALGPLVAAYTAALLTDTAVPAWHEGFREMPFVFVGSAASAAGGLGILAAPLSQSRPAWSTATCGAALELLATSRMQHRLGSLAVSYRTGRAGALLHAAQALTAGGAVTALALGRHSRRGAALAGLALLAGSALTRFGIFAAGLASATDPAQTVGPQRARLAEQAAASPDR